MAVNATHASVSAELVALLLVLRPMEKEKHMRYRGFLSAKGSNLMMMTHMRKTFPGFLRRMVTKQGYVLWLSSTLTWDCSYWGG